MSNDADVIVIGAGAAGLMCAIEAGKRARKVLVLDHANKCGKKILMSGGGRCNFTNYHITFDNYISHNPNFCKSALSRYTQWDFISLVDKYNIKYSEKKHGQLFCDHKSSDILSMLLSECDKYKVKIELKVSITKIEKQQNGDFKLYSDGATYHCKSLVVATGGLSIPTMGASPFGYKVAEQFGIKIWPTRAGLVPFTAKQNILDKFAAISGVSTECIAFNTRQAFKGFMLFTHRGISGPAILQISSYWQQGEGININFFPNQDLFSVLKQKQLARPNVMLKTVLSEKLPKSLLPVVLREETLNSAMHSFSHKSLEAISSNLQSWYIQPSGTEGYRTAEVTLGGVDCNAICSKTMQAKDTPGLYFIGEVLDVTGWLGGFNFQWAWSSGWAAGQYV